jgi:alpha-glucoside transport system permease protein
MENPLKAFPQPLKNFEMALLQMKDRPLVWSGNKRSRELRLYDRQWVGFDTNLTLKNYQDVLTGKTITYQDAEGRTITRTGNNLGIAFLNSWLLPSQERLSHPDCCFCSLWICLVEFSRQEYFLHHHCCLVGCAITDCLVPILQDYVKMGLNGTFLGIWLAHAGFGLTFGNLPVV